MVIKKFKFILIIFIIVILIVFMYMRGNKGREVHHFNAKDGTKGDYLMYPAKHPKGTLVWLHGDGAYEYHHPDSRAYLSGKDGIKQVAKEKNLTLIVPKTVSEDGTWWKKGKANTQYLVELISSLPNHDRLWIGSFSGGSETTTYWLLDRLPEMNVKSGGAVLFGGGGSPKKEGIVKRLEKSKHIKGSFPLTWIVGEHDHEGGQTDDDPFDALITSKEGEAFYASQGWDTKRIVAKHYHHLIIKDDIGQYGAYLKENIK
ncbi:hypothetical protein [Mammaliicoccus vitulinus]|uniref:hypothetical protein n=1 Tax=Mammaliicoccus vitulinus TaxID=71237 RepID=UPI000D1DB003|nr:hypothetical protein [Mammaliicoccus vitulinus]PTI71352.1 hypothetical protein BU073_07730 [Mammaliicoccus vitulinus]QJF24042.1 hypothetical protein HF021_00375 [Mammaliicoccus vitulinus]HAL10205.1 hypothetical protein [Staphylococcus sp.]